MVPAVRRTSQLFMKTHFDDGRAPRSSGYANCSSLRWTLRGLSVRAARLLQATKSALSKQSSEWS
jgi:hypothetical protein